MPGYDLILVDDSFTQTKIYVLIAIMYTLTVLFIGQFVFALVNTWMFLIKQKKYTTWPLLAFYLLAMFLSLLEAYVNFSLFFVVCNRRTFAVEMRPIIKIAIGIVQCWMLFELALRINLEIKTTDSMRLSTIHISGDRKSRQLQVNNIGARTEKIIRFGRVILLGSMAVALLFLSGYFLFYAGKLGIKERTHLNEEWVDGIGWSFFGLALLLLASVAFLINRLKRKRD